MKVKEILKEAGDEARLDQLILQALKTAKMNPKLLPSARMAVRKHMERDRYAPTLKDLTVGDIINYMDDAGFQPSPDND